MPSILGEVAIVSVFWPAFLCRALLGFDPLFLIHRGPSATAREYFWFAIGFTVLCGAVVVWKYSIARILHARGVEIVGTIASVRGKSKSDGWTVEVRYTVNGKDYTVVRNTQLQTRPPENQAVPVVYDPQKPERCWAGFGKGKK